MAPQPDSASPKAPQITFDTAIRDRALNCIRLFADCMSNAVINKLNGLEMGRADFNLWVRGLNATAQGKSSLDYRVRWRADVKSHICDLLDGLAECMRETLDLGMCTNNCFGNQYKSSALDV
jgi:hypothetical protein